MALYPDYDRDEAFKAMGKSIARFNELTTQIQDLEDIAEEHIPLLNESDQTRDFLNNVMDTRGANKDRLEAAKDDCIANVTEYLTTGIVIMLDVVTEGAADVIALVLDALEDAMYLNNDSVECNLIPPPTEPPEGEPDLKADIDNQGVGKIIWENPYRQQVHNDLDFEFECFDASTPGSERWTVKNDKEDSLGILTTDVVFEDVKEKYGHTFLISRITVIEEGADPLASFANWSLTGALKRRGNEYNVAALSRGNSDFWGVYWAELIDAGGGNRTVNLYSDSTLSTLVATGTRAGNGTVNLVAAGGSGLTGSVDIAYTGDTTISIKYPFQFQAGDKYYFKSEVGTSKLFQTFFVENYDRALPCDDPSTVNEDWAKWGLP